MIRVFVVTAGPVAVADDVVVVDDDADQPLDFRQQRHPADANEHPHVGVLDESQSKLRELTVDEKDLERAIAL